MRNISARAWALVVFSALLQVLMFPTGGPAGPWRPMLCWLALAPFLVALGMPGKDGAALTTRATAGLGYVCGMLWYLGNCFWIYQTMYIYGGLPKPVSFLILILFSLYLGLYHGLFACLFSLIHRLGVGWKGAVLLAPAVWVAVELARARITGFPWDLLGYAQTNNSVVTKLAPVAGVMGISFVIAAVNALFAYGVSVKGRARTGSLAAGVLVCAALEVTGLRTHAVAAPQHAVLLQENLSVGATGRGEANLSLQDELDSFISASQRPTPLVDGGSATPTVIVWPEAPSHLQTNNPVFKSQLGMLAAKSHVPVIAGSLGVDIDATAARGYYLYDSASLFDQDGSYAGRYDKIHLVPWGEYVPFKRFFAFAEKLTEGVGDMDPGHERTVFHSGGYAYGVFICYESIFGDEVREFAKSGAQVLVNISDDGWYGDTGAPWQHLNMARMRAIENNRWVLRSTNTGVTTAIDPLGRVAAEAPRHVRGAFEFPFDFVQGTTFYTEHGDWFAWLCVIATVGGLTRARIRVRVGRARPRLGRIG